MGFASPHHRLLPPKRSWIKRLWYALGWHWAVWLQRFRCANGMCGGYVVSGVHAGEIWCGWRCNQCKKVKYYEPTGKRVDQGRETT